MITADGDSRSLTLLNNEQAQIEQVYPDRYFLLLKIISYLYFVKFHLDYLFISIVGKFICYSWSKIRVPSRKSFFVVFD